MQFGQGIRTGTVPVPKKEASDKPKPLPSMNMQGSLFGAPASAAEPEPKPEPKSQPTKTPAKRTKKLNKKAPFQTDGQDTSREAAQSISDCVLNELQLKVLEAIIEYPNGAICEEVEIRMGLRHQTASARINDLQAAGYIEDSGERRHTTSGRNAIVWKATAKAKE